VLAILKPEVNLSGSIFPEMATKTSVPAQRNDVLLRLKVT